MLCQHIDVISIAPGQDTLGQRRHKTSELASSPAHSGVAHIDHVHARLRAQVLVGAARGHVRLVAELVAVFFVRGEREEQHVVLNLRGHGDFWSTPIW